MNTQTKGNKTALISVTHKEGIDIFVQGLLDNGYTTILSSGGTAKYLAERGIPVTDIATIVGAPMLGHRVVTLSRQLHAGLLARFGHDMDIAEMEELGLPYIDLVCVDFYELGKAITAPGATKESIIEATDIGGPTMVRSAAKGRRIVICDPNDRISVLQWIMSGEIEHEKILDMLVAKAEITVAHYALTSGLYHDNENQYAGFIGTKSKELRYGENAYQTPAVMYSTGSNEPLVLTNFETLAGTMGYNNVTDLDRSLQTMTHIAAVMDRNFNFVPLIALGVKHGNACGASMGNNHPAELIQNMLNGDLTAIFGATMIFNFAIDATLATILVGYKMPEGKRRVIDMIIAPDFEEGALEILERKQGKCKILRNPELKNLGMHSLDIAPRVRYVRGGFIVQPNYTFVPLFVDAEKHGEEATEFQLYDIALAWAISCTSNSNTITIVKDRILLANAVGQQDRVGAVKLALKKASRSVHNCTGAVAVSDSFFPFPDAPGLLVAYGIKIILTTTGSLNDQQMFEACKDIVLYTYPDSVARGFYAH